MASGRVPFCCKLLICFYIIEIRIILVLNKKLEKLFIAPKVRQELHETAFVAFATKGQRE